VHAAGGPLAGLALDRATEERLLALDPERISPEDVREVLARAPAPRIIGLHGSVPIVTMAPFAEFLIAMGYPAERLRNPRDGRYTYSSFTDSREIAGALAWHYEHEGSMPMLIGHSQGGMLTVKVLQDLAGASGERINVWNPVTGAAEDRFTIVDPVTGAERPVVGLKVPYAAALATGSLMRVLLGQWGMLARLRSVPDTVDEFTGYFIEWDVIAGTSPASAQDNPYRPAGTAKVRNLTLPAEYSHISLPAAEHLAANEVTRAWIERYTPGSPLPARDGLDTRNLLHAADIWFSVKKHWCLEAQRLVRAQRAVLQARR
jgi:pimeloyl-ACP methyl ester carboxylesterase